MAVATLFANYIPSMNPRPPLFIAVLLASLLLAPSLRAHGSFDHGARVWLWADNLEVTVTMGPEAAKVFLNQGPEEVRHAGHMEMVFPLPPESAARIFELKSGDTILTPLKTTVRSDGLEYVFGFIYPPTGSAPLHFNARYLNESPKLTKGALVVVNENDTMLVGKILSLEDHQIDFTPPAKTIAAVVGKNAVETNSANTNDDAVAVAQISAPTSPPVVTPSFGEFLKLGIGHILNIDAFDHLLFLTALLLGCRRMKTMLLVITGFTVAHSLTLALAALNVVTISSRIIEPAIAASIIFVAAENFRSTEKSWHRYALTCGFGLIHGFGFAGALQEKGLATGTAMFKPLLAFNLGVEIGQLTVAAVVLPLLLLLQRWPWFARNGARVISALVILVAAFWLWQRVTSSGD